MAGRAGIAEISTGPPPMEKDRICLDGLGPFNLPHVQRTSVRNDRDGVVITMRAVGGTGTVPVNVHMVPRTASELAAQISASVRTRMPPTTAPADNLGQLIAALDVWIAEQSDPKPSRPEAIRLGLRTWLTGIGLIPEGDPGAA